MSTNNIFLWRNKKQFTGYPILSRAMLHIKSYHAMGRISRRQHDDTFLIFPRKLV